MKIALKNVLELNDISKPTFDSRRRGGHYGFMYEAADGDDEVSQYVNSRAQFGIEHAVALGCIEFAVSKCGMTLERADSVVGNNFGPLIEAIRDGSIDPEPLQTNGLDHFMVGAVFHLQGRSHCAGPPGVFSDAILKSVLNGSDPDRHYDEMPAGVVMIDATSVYREIKARMLGRRG